MSRLWKFIRIIILAFLAWFTLALLWAFLPSPSWERDGGDVGASEYATSVLRSGKTLMRVYNDDHLHLISKSERASFALDYRFDAQTFDLSVSGSRMFASILGDGRSVLSDSEEMVDITARAGDTDGANLPWFEHADAVLLFWWIHRDTFQFPLRFSRTEDARSGDYELRLATLDYPQTTMLSISMRGNDSGTIRATVPSGPVSSSPSMTYPVRIVLLALVAPIAVVVNNVLGTAFAAIGDIILAVFAIAMYGFLILAVVISFWRCVGGYSLDETMGRVQERLEALKGHPRLGWMPVDKVKDGLDGLYRNRVVVRFIGVCTEGWHPERDALRALEEEQEDVEKGDAGTSDPPTQRDSSAKLDRQNY